MKNKGNQKPSDRMAVSVRRDTYELVQRLRQHFAEQTSIDVKITHACVLENAVKLLAEREGIK